MGWLEILGYAASVLVAVSLTMSSIVKLRVYNLIGAVAFAVYGGLVGAYPVLAVNGFIAVVNVVYLLRMRRLEESFDLLEIPRPDNKYVGRFLDFHADDVARFFPCFERDRLEGAAIVFILRNMLPVGLVVCRDADREAVIELDYVIPSYRDLQCARYFYRVFGAAYRDRGVEAFTAHAAAPEHASYLERMNFLPDTDRGPDFYRRPLSA